MSSYTVLAARWGAGLLLVIALSACSQDLSTGRAAAPTPEPAARSYLWSNTFAPIKENGSALRFQHYSIEEGLSQSSVQAIAQDDLGFLWVGTQDGLNRFDGYSFRTFRPDPNDPRSLSGAEILSLLPGRDGGLWVGTNAGLNRYDPVSGSFEHWSHSDQDADSLASNLVQAIHQGPRNILWVGTSNGLDEFDPASGRFTHLNLMGRPSGSASPDMITAIYVDRHETLWIGTADGLVSYDPRPPRIQRFRSIPGDAQSISASYITSISQDEAGLLWIGTRHGLNRLDPATGRFTRFIQSDEDPGGISDDFVMATYVDRAGQVWIGTRDGLDRFNSAQQQFVHYRSDPGDPSSLSNNAISTIYEDRGGVLWLGTINGGLNQHDRSQDRFAYYHHIPSDPDSLSGDVIFPIAPTTGGKVWIGTYQAGLNLFDPLTGRSQRFRHDPSNPDSLLDDTVLSLYLDKDNTLWVGTHLGLDRLYAGSTKFFHYVSRPEDLKSIPFGAVYRVFQDRQSTYWVGTAQGIRVFDPVTGDFHTADMRGADPAGLSGTPARVIFQDHTGILWFGTDEQGLYRLNPSTNRLEHYVNDPNSKGSLSSNAVMDMYEDSRGILWIATFGGGLNRYLPERDAFQSFRQAEGLPNDVVYGILEDATGNLWLSTNQGLSRFDVSSGVFENFTARDGLQSSEFNSSSFAMDAAGRMYFGGVRGLTVFDPADIDKNPYIPPLVITSLSGQDGQPLLPGRTPEVIPEITLSFPQNSFSVGFSALSFSNAGRNQYQYMLEGYDSNWRKAGAERRASYANLPGGRYTLRILGSNSDGVWNESGTAMKVTVIPPFWQTWTFRGFAGLALIAAVVFAYRSRMLGIQAQRAELERVIVERTQALKKQNLDLEALYAADEKMLRVLTQDDVWRALVDVAVDILRADKSAVFTQTAGHADFSLRVSRGFRPETVRSTGFARSQQATLQNVAAGVPLVIDDTAFDAAWKEQPGAVEDMMAAEGVRSLMYVPIQVQDIALGVFSVFSSEPGAFSEDRQRLFSSLVQRAALSIENSRLFEQTKHMAVLEERNRLAQELHDSAKQKAFAALAQLGAAKKLVDHSNGSAAQRLDEAEDIVSEVIHDLNFFIQDFYSGGMKEKGLAASVREHASAWESRFGIRLSLSVVNERRLPLQIEQALYRIVQEGLSNIARHSQATQANLSLIYEEQELRMEIGDNGQGFDLTGTDHGLGLRLVHERLESIGGQVRIETRHGQGTLLRIRVPIPVTA